MSNESSEPPAAAPSKGGRSKLLYIGAAVFVLLAGGAGAFVWQASSDAPEAADAGEAAPEPSEAQGIVPLEPFVVNLADREASRFLRTTISLLVDGPEAADAIAHDEISLTVLRSAILELLAQQTSEHLGTVDGKAALKVAITEQASDLLADARVTDVLFTDFVIQY